MQYWSARLSTLLIVIIAYLISTSKGGLLSSYLHAKSYYLVQRLPDTDKSQWNEDSGKVLVGDKGSVNSNWFTDCGSTAQVKRLGLSSCVSGQKQLGEKGVKSDICEIHRGSNVTFTLSFIPHRDATQLKAVIHGIVDFVPIPFPCPQPDACHNSGIKCPLVAGKEYDYTLSAVIKESYPRMKLWVKGQLEDEDGNNVVCVKMHVHTV